MSGIPNIVYPAENMITLNTMDDRIKNTLDAWLKYGTVFLVYRLCTYFFFDRDKPNTELFDKESLLLVLYILIGFTVYYMLVAPYIPVNMQHPILRNLTNDMLMFGTVLVSSHILEAWMNNGDFFNKEWLKTAGIILLSFAAYDIIVNPFIPFNTMNPRTAPIVYDWAKFGTFLIVFRLLQGRSLLDQRWILSVLFVLLGFTGYHLVTKKLVDVD
ncbi:hypothetical protein QJ857_gp0909 [Tupanvirus soda lake]|uniref:Uncharacterized protein n=2 Tax=Tupanvirus TaxID=2094720 RepID=A0A6N1NUQ6_9VIRU|nr:hypothetical protein QJ857_gp0909 [Tupanvirus soda lake]QKU35143.1 hypothetical protein [Tupanvirus soda lake]